MDFPSGFDSITAFLTAFSPVLVFCTAALALWSKQRDIAQSEDDEDTQEVEVSAHRETKPVDHEKLAETQNGIKVLVQQFDARLAAEIKLARVEIYQEYEDKLETQAHRLGHQADELTEMENKTAELRGELKILERQKDEALAKWLECLEDKSNK